MAYDFLRHALLFYFYLQCILWLMMIMANEPMADVMRNIGLALVIIIFHLVMSVHELCCHCHHVMLMQLYLGIA